MRRTLLGGSMLACLLAMPAIAQTPSTFTPGTGISSSAVNVFNGTKADAVNGTLMAPTIVTPSLNLDGTARLATGWLNTSTTLDKNVFIGGTIGMPALTIPVNVTQMLASGKIGSYQHGTGMSALTSTQRSALFATWGLPPGGSGQSVGESDCSQTTEDITGTYGTSGLYPVEVNINCVVGASSYTAGAGDVHPGTVYGGFVSPADLTTIETAINVKTAKAAKNVAPVITPNGSNFDFDDLYATSAYWANVRAAAAYGGGLALDTPPVYFLAQSAAYQSIIAQMIQYEVSAGFRVSLILSPFLSSGTDPNGNTGANAYDPLFVEHAMAEIGILRSLNALPTQIIAENYATVGDPNQPVNDTTPESMNALALYLARSAYTAPSGTTPNGALGVAEAGLMAQPGVAPVISANLSPNHPGPLTMADFPGVFGDMAAQSAGRVQIYGGMISGSINLRMIKQPFFEAGVVLQGGTSSPIIAGNTAGDVSITGSSGAAGLVVTGALTAGTGLQGASGGSVTVRNGATFQSPGANSVGLNVSTDGVLSVAGTSGLASISVSGGIQNGRPTVSGLPACSGAAAGTHLSVTDATAPTFLGTLTGGGTVETPVYCNGTAWVAG
jgi:hypothetical protein